MKLLFGIILALSITGVAHADRHCIAPAACLPMNFEVQIFGKEMAPKQEDYDTVRRAIGSLVADMKIKKYVFKLAGDEGGFLVCVESMDAHAHPIVLQTLQSIRVDERQTRYEIKRVDSCGN
ncbi:MAG: hypothetical protein ACXWQO_16540 [Bdellovibrionota bacterium]